MYPQGWCCCSMLVSRGWRLTLLGAGYAMTYVVPGEIETPVSKVSIYTVFDNEWIALHGALSLTMRKRVAS